jgi:Fe-S-cluster-containing hydrogenase component 2/CRP-like cAMP-binding protein
MNNPIEEEIFQQYESQYVTDLDGKLIRIEKATQADFNKQMTVTIDGVEIKGIPKAVPQLDDQGNIVRDEDGQTKPRLTTVYDAITFRYKDTDAHFPGPDPKNPVPVLCHQSHQRPIGVCRVCSCLTVKKGAVGEKLIPSCQHPLVDEMEVHTVASTVMVKAPGHKEPVAAGEFLSKSVRVLLELLAANSLHEEQPADNRRYRNELLDLCERFGIPIEPAGGDRISVGTQFKPRPYHEELQDDSSKVIHVDHNNCILCDRCVRGCSEVKPFKIIGHTGFGNKARISFDLDAPMGQSGCVSCGECTISCPTGALSFKTSIYQNRDPWADEEHKRHKPATIKAERLEQHPLFAGVPYSFLKWNEGAVGEVQIAPGEELCKAGDYGSTAFLIEGGSVDVMVNNNAVASLTNKEYIVGERAVMAHQPRSAGLRAGNRGAKLWVVKRNMMHMLQRNRTARTVLRPIYRQRALDNYLRRGTLFADLTDAQNAYCSQFLSARDDVELIQVDPTQPVFLQNQGADAFYVIALGHVTIEETKLSGHKVTMNYLGRGRSFGEIGLLSRISDDIGGIVESHRPGSRGTRTFTCAALDHVELVVIPQEAFESLLKANREVNQALIANARKTLANPPPPVGSAMGEFTEMGLHQGQKLMVLDLNRCTRCQECVKACSDSHDGVTRLVLEGNRFEKYLVPSACRSCHDPACLTGCPVDAIHRRPGATGLKAQSLAIFIENHCIGCGLCAHNCPFGSIHMLKKDDAPATFRWDGKGIQGRRVATNCDLCESLDGDPRCVKNCPHEAAIREDAIQVAKRVNLKPAACLP